MTLGSKIRMHRKALGLTQTELGEKLGVKVNDVSKWECGRVEGIPISKIKALANLFDVPPSYLIDDEVVQKDLTAEKQALYDFADSLTDEQAQRLLQMAKAAFGE